MSVGALSPEAHQALTIGIQRAGGAANTGEGGEDPAWYVAGADGRRRDARIKQVASARFGVTATYLARADQLEIKIAQGSKPGEGGQLPGRKATAYIAALRRGQAGQSYISPPPHHDIYSIEDLAQLIADLRAINPAARIGVKLVAVARRRDDRGGRRQGRRRRTSTCPGTPAGRERRRCRRSSMSGRRGSSGWPRSTRSCCATTCATGWRCAPTAGCRPAGTCWSRRCSGAEEFAFGTSALVAIGCDMARQCHLDTCPTGIATQREDLRAKFPGTPEMVETFFLAIAEDLRRELAAVGARSVGEVVGESRRAAAAGRRSSWELGAVVGAASWDGGCRPAGRPGTAGADGPPCAGIARSRSASRPRSATRGR